MAAKIMERAAKTIVAPPPRDLVDSTLVVVSVWRAQDEAVVLEAVEKGKERAAEGNDSKLGKMIFGALRFFGFGYIESTGMGGIAVKPIEGREGVYEITLTIGVRVENIEALALGLVGLTEKVKSMPAGILASVLGMRPGQASLIDIKVDMA
jgi:hypothetical protein